MLSCKARQSPPILIKRASSKLSFGLKLPLGILENNITIYAQIFDRPNQFHENYHEAAKGNFENPKFSVENPTDHTEETEN